MTVTGEIWDILFNVIANQMENPCSNDCQIILCGPQPGYLADDKTAYFCIY